MTTGTSKQSCRFSELGRLQTGYGIEKYGDWVNLGAGKPLSNCQAENPQLQSSEADHRYKYADTSVSGHWTFADKRRNVHRLPTRKLGSNLTTAKQKMSAAIASKSSYVAVRFTEQCCVPKCGDMMIRSIIRLPRVQCQVMLAAQSITLEKSL